MAVNTHDARTVLVQKALEQVRARLEPPQASAVEEFVRQFYSEAAADDLEGLDLYGAALAHWKLVQRRQPGEAKVKVYDPQIDEHAWRSTHTVVEIVTDDMPFLVDSVAMAITRHGSAIHLFIHPVVQVRRDEQGQLLELLPDDARADGTLHESLIHVEIDRTSDHAGLETELRRALADVHASVEDWAEMRARIREAIAELDESPPPVDPEEVAEVKALLEWLDDHHFTFLGYREYELGVEGGEDVLASVPGSGLGILREREPKRISRSFSDLPPEVRRLARAPNLLNLTKANSRATVHRPSYLDYVGVKRFGDDGEVWSERRFLGLYTSTAYSASPWQIPVLRKRVQRIVDRSGFTPGSHDYKALVEILETYPRDELFQIDENELYEAALGILHLGERRRVRVFVRRDTFGRFVSGLVYLPLERYTTEARQKIQEILQRAFGGQSVDWSARISESVLARLHLIIYTTSGEVPDVDVAAIEAEIVETIRSWSDDLRVALLDQLGEARGTDLYRRYGEAFPAAYRDDFTAQAAVADIERIERLDPAGDLDLSLYLPLEPTSTGQLAFKLIRSGRPILLSDVLPLLENMGVKVTDERPYEIRPIGGDPVWIYDFGLEYRDVEFQADRVRQIFQDAFARVWRGEVENDGFNRLVLAAELTWREIGVLRAISKYLRQAGSTFSQTYMEEALVANPNVARLLVELYLLRFRPPRHEAVEARAHDLGLEVERALEAVASLDQDRILRSFLAVVRAMLRTNYFQTGEDGAPKPYLSFKLDPSGIPDLPMPRPEFEIFVHSTRMEGVHLRAGAVARGGIRWSDRREDFRTEILGLMKAQTVKNAVIVPTGAKGGFVVKQPPADRDALREEVVACYSTLVRGLLDVTDNLDGDVAVPPPEVVRYDAEDPYLVVAADKGTATFSDLANTLAAEYGFWLGDAFASGGSAGYDHKEMAITARGAWESVKRHFRELGTDIQTTDFTAVGIGDMSGDVFGNGMLLSRHVKLIAAFDHRHVFLDPDPDPATSYDERARLFGLPTSSWADYDPELISAGGGVYPRAAKAIPLSPELQAALGLEAQKLTPNELIRAILRAKVDLLWNGGIGTFVKAPDETHEEVGDRAGDAIRVDSDELRCRVIGEGGNLGLTQRARIDFALRGGRVLMDAIDNSAGVDCSDHEVNIKILLDQVVRDGDLTVKQRNALLAEMTEEVAQLVLRDNYEQTQAISTSSAQAAPMIDVHARYIHALEHEGRLDRALEFLPNDETLSERKAAKLGLTPPELAILLSYTKIVLYQDLLASDLPDDQAVAAALAAYFPEPVRRRFPDQIARHPLRREIVAAQLTNEVVNRGGTTFVFRLSEETGAGAADIARAFVVARDVFALRELWAEIEALDGKIVPQTQTAMMLRARILLERSTRWLLRNRSRPIDIAEACARYAEPARELAAKVPQLLGSNGRASAQEDAASLAAVGVPQDLADRVVHLEALVPLLDMVELSEASGTPVAEVGATYYRVGDRLGLHQLREQIAKLPREERWDALARRALWEDLHAEQRALTADVLETPTDEDADRVETWFARNGTAVQRCQSVLEAIRTGGGSELATLSVAVREIRNLIDATVD